jgi:hypothetical protein
MENLYHLNIYLFRHFYSGRLCHKNIRAHVLEFAFRFLVVIFYILTVFPKFHFLSVVLVLQKLMLYYNN